MKKIPQSLRDQKSATNQAGEKTSTSWSESKLLKVIFALLFENQRPPGIPSCGRSRCAGTCSGRQSCKRNMACLLHVSYRGTGRPAHLLETFQVSTDDLIERFAQMRRASFCSWNAFGAVLSGLVYSRINTCKAHNGAAARKTTHITDLGHELRGSCFTNAYMAHTVSSTFAFVTLWARQSIPPLE